MLFQSTEEKIIYEKLTAGRNDTITDPRSDTFSYNQYQVSAINVDLLQNRMKQVAGFIGTLEHTRENHSYRPLLSNRKILGNFVVFIKRVIRKLTSWYIEPVCQQQTAFNNAVTPSVGCINEINNEIINNVLTLFREQENHRIAQQTEMEQTARKFAEIERAFNTQVNRRQTETMEVLHAMEQRLSQQQQALKDVQQAGAGQLNDLQSKMEAGAGQLNDLQNKMDKLNELDLDIFTQDYKDSWEKDVRGIGTFAQCGEDMVISFMLNALEIPLNEATYVDLGANHAKKLSNTYHFYRQGARGVLVEANPSLIPELKFYRNGDAILNRCVSEQSGKMVDFYVMGTSYADGDGLSTADKDSAEESIQQNSVLKIHDVVSVETISVNDIVENHMGKTPVILNIDIEGNELEVLKSIDFNPLRKKSPAS